MKAPSAKPHKTAKQPKSSTSTASKAVSAKKPKKQINFTFIGGFPDDFWEKVPKS